MKLNLGCGNNIHNGYVNIDIQPLPDVDHQIDVRNLDDVCEDDTVEYILALDVLQTFSYKEVINVLIHWAEKLKPGGLIKVSVPDIIELSTGLVSELIKPDDFLLRIYGHHQHANDFNNTGFDSVLLQNVLVKVGLNIKSKRIVDSKIIIVAEKPNE